ncbi:MAG: class II fructose-bisphosphate aldolase [Acutalibacter sp.]
MPLVQVNKLLRHATENHYGVAAVNVFNYETVKWVAEAANRERIPVIIQFYPGFEKYIALKHVAAIAKDFAEKSEVPIGVHLNAFRQLWDSGERCAGWVPIRNGGWLGAAL